jgi:hypothetical protein
MPALATATLMWCPTGEICLDCSCMGVASHATTGMAVCCPCPAPFCVTAAPAQHMPGMPQEVQSFEWDGQHLRTGWHVNCDHVHI